MYDRIVGGEVMIVGDLHFSDVFTGKHKDYLQECMWVLRQISDKIEERKPSALVLLGDIVGWSETNIRNRQIFSMFCKTLKSWNAICPVYAVKGNHDIKGYPDFQFLSDLGLIITSAACGGHFDYYGFEGQEIPEVRFHLVDYMDESRHLEIYDGTSNIVLGHNNFTIEGYTTWYQQHDGIELGLLQNFSDIEMVISGHIHNPSPEFYATEMVSGNSCLLFYVGCPTRPIKDQYIYDSCWYVFAKYNKDTKTTDINPEPFPLLSIDEVFYKDEEFVTDKTAEEIEDETRRAALKDVLDDLLKYRMQTGSPIDQVMLIPNASQEAKEMAVRYLQTAFNSGGK